MYLISLTDAFMPCAHLQKLSDVLVRIYVRPGAPNKLGDASAGKSRSPVEKMDIVFKKFTLSLFMSLIHCSDSCFLLVTGLVQTWPFPVESKQVKGGSQEVEDVDDQERTSNL